MRDKTASIELSSIARRYYEVKRDVTCYNFTVVFDMVVPTVIKSIMKGNLHPGRQAKTQSIRMNSRNDMTSSTWV